MKTIVFILLLSPLFLFSTDYQELLVKRSGGRAGGSTFSRRSSGSGGSYSTPSTGKSFSSGRSSGRGYRGSRGDSTVDIIIFIFEYPYIAGGVAIFLIWFGFFREEKEDKERRLRLEAAEQKKSSGKYRITGKRRKKLILPEQNEPAPEKKVLPEHNYTTLTAQFALGDPSPLRGEIDQQIQQCDFDDSEKRAEFIKKLFTTLKHNPDHIHHYRFIESIPGDSAVLNKIVYNQTVYDEVEKLKHDPFFDTKSEGCYFMVIAMLHLENYLIDRDQPLNITLEKLTNIPVSQLISAHIINAPVDHTVALSKRDIHNLYPDLNQRD